MAIITNLFPPSSVPARAKFPFFDRLDFHPERMLSHYCSLHIEHVSPSDLICREISPRSGFTGVPNVATFASVRLWPAARKPDAGSVFTDDPATLLQAIMFDERLGGLQEDLAIVCSFPRSHQPVVVHYCTVGFHFNGADLAA